MCVGKSKKYLKLGVKIQMVVDDSGILSAAKESWGGYLYFHKGRQINTVTPLNGLLKMGS